MPGTGAPVAEATGPVTVETTGATADVAADTTEPPLLEPPLPEPPVGLTGCGTVAKLTDAAADVTAERAEPAPKSELVAGCGVTAAGAGGSEAELTGAAAEVAGAVAEVAGAVAEPELVVAGAEPLLAEVAAELAGAGAEVAGARAVAKPELVVAGCGVTAAGAGGSAAELAGPGAELAGARAVVAGAVGVGVVAACAGRENSRKAVRIPAATIAPCTARRAMRRTISCGTSSSRSTGTDRIEARSAHHLLPETPGRTIFGFFHTVSRNRTVCSVTTVQPCALPGKGFTGLASGDACRFLGFGWQGRGSGLCWLSPG